MSQQRKQQTKQLSPFNSGKGAYNTCGHLCRYCYANYDEKTVRENQKKHNPDSPLLLSGLTDADVIHEAKQESWRDMQLRLW